MNDGWQRKRLGDVCDFKGGGTPSKAVDRYWQGDIPWVSPKDMKSQVIDDSIDHISPEAVAASATSIIDVGAVLMVVRSGILARTVPIALAGRALAMNQDLKALCPRPSIDSWFLYYLLEAKMSELLGLVSTGATVHRLITDQIRAVEFMLPPLPAQRRIVAILDEAFEGIATAKANAEKSLQNAGEWAAGQLAAVLYAALSDGRSGALESLVAPSCTLSYGIVQPGDEVQGGLPVVRPVDLGNKTVVAAGLKRIDPAQARSYARTTLEGDDLLLCVRGTTGTVAIAEPALAGANVTRGIVPIRFDPNTINQALGYYLLRSGPVQAQIRAKTYGTALMQINIGDLRKVVVSFPPIEKQAVLVEQLDAIQDAADQLVDVYARKLAALAELKQSLLHQAFTGAL